MKSLYELGIEYEQQLFDLKQEIDDLTVKIKKERNFQKRQALQKLKCLKEDEALELKMDAETLKHYYDKE